MTDTQGGEGEAVQREKRKWTEKKVRLLHISWYEDQHLFLQKKMRFVHCPFLTIVISSILENSLHSDTKQGDQEPGVMQDWSI